METGKQAVVKWRRWQDYQAMPGWDRREDDRLWNDFIDAMTDLAAIATAVMANQTCGSGSGDCSCTPEED